MNTELLAYEISERPRNDVRRMNFSNTWHTSPIINTEVREVAIKSRDFSEAYFVNCIIISSLQSNLYRQLHAAPHKPLRS